MAGGSIDPRIRARRVAVLRAEGRRRLRVVTLLLGLVAVAVGAWGISRSALLDLDHVRIDGVDAAQTAAVLVAVDLEPGTPLFDLDLGSVEESVTALPWVSSAVASREWPGTVRVEVVPRVAVASIGVGAEQYAIDAEAVLLGPVPAGSTLPVVATPVTVGAGEVEDTAVEALVLVEALTDDLMPWLQAVTVETASTETATARVGLRLIGDVEVLLGAAEFLPDKLEALRSVLQGTDLSCIDEIDLVVADLPVIGRDLACDAAS